MIEKYGSLIYGTEDEIMDAIKEKERQRKRGRKAKQNFEIQKYLEMQKYSIICALQSTYAEYKKAIAKSIQYTGYDDNGEFYVIAGQEERNARVKQLEEDLIRLLHRLAVIKDGIKESSDADSN